MHAARLVVPLAFLLASACSDTRQGCQLLAPSVSAGDSAQSDWHAEALKLLASAPLDSSMYIVVSPAAASVRAWADSSPDVAITYVFHNISAFTISMPVRALADMVNLEGIAWIDWGSGRDYQLCW